MYIGKFLFLIIFWYFFLNYAGASNLYSDNNISNIELVGTVTGKYALAILRIKNQSEGIYQLNQKILGYTISAILEKSIIVTKHNNAVTLTLVPVANRRSFDINTRQHHQTSVVTYEYRINRKLFNSLHQDTQSWLNNIRFKMHLDDGYFSGYRITYIRKNSPAALLGLTEGDIITGINDILIKQNPENFINSIGLLTNLTQFTLNIRHKELAINLTFRIEDDINY